jgi:hypothetical protein
VISKPAQVRGILAEEVVVSTVLDPFLSLRALAAYANLSVRKLRDYLDGPTHPLPCYRVGGKILVRRSEFDSWMAAFRCATPGLDTIVRAALTGLGASRS